MFKIVDDGTYYVVYKDDKRFCKHRKDINNLELLKNHYGITK